MQKITELLNALGNCLCGAAKLFGEYNTYREVNNNLKCLSDKKAQQVVNEKKKS
jgi:hypothetical protein